jgi:hypothetical protein
MAERASQVLPLLVEAATYAGYHLDEATVQHRCHPQTGITMPVTGRVVFRGRTLLVSGNRNGRV